MSARICGAVQGLQPGHRSVPHAIPRAAGSRRAASASNELRALRSSTRGAKAKGRGTLLPGHVARGLAAGHWCPAHHPLREAACSSHRCNACSGPSLFNASNVWPVGECDRRCPAVPTLARLQRWLRTHKCAKEPTAPARPTPAMAKYSSAEVYTHACLVHSTTTSHKSGYAAVHLVCSTHKLSMPAGGSRSLLAQHFGPVDREGDGEPAQRPGCGRLRLVR